MLQRDFEMAPGRREVLDDVDKDFLVHLQQSGLLHWDWQYVSRLEKERGVSVSVSVIQKLFAEKMGSKFIDVNPTEVDKWTAENWLQLQEFCHALEGVERHRLRFYDQTGLTFNKIVSTRTRHIPGMPKPRARAVSSNATKHHSYFGMTCLRLDKPAVCWKHYPTNRENNQTGKEHCDFFLTAEREGWLDPGDIIVCDQWGGHTGARGRKLEEYMWKYCGVTFLFLPAHFSHLNSSEHSWGRSKNFAKHAVVSMNEYDASYVTTFMEAGLDNITHYDVLKDMVHDGYGVEAATVDAIQMFSSPSLKLKEFFDF